MRRWVSSQTLRVSSAGAARPGTDPAGPPYHSVLTTRTVECEVSKSG